MRPALLAMVVLMLSGCDSLEVVMSDLQQKDANDALVVLREQHIDAKKESISSKKAALYQIMVKKSQAEKALRILVDHRLLQSERALLKDIYPPGGGGLIPTKSEEMARFLMASQGEIEALLKVIPGIRDARVVLAFDPPTDLLKTPQKKSASVALIYLPKDNFGSPPLSDLEVKGLVASSITGLQPDDVTVVQKTITTLVDDSHDKALPSSPITKQEPLTTDNHMIWYLLAITILALLVATYGVFRLFMVRRASPKFS